MARYSTVFKKPNSPFYYVAYWCPERLKRIFRATPFRIDDPAGRRRALDLARERSQEALAAKSGPSSQWASWVDSWLALRHRNSPRTLEGERLRWSHVAHYFETREIVSPAAVTYDIALDYIAWRTGQTKRVSKKHPSFNTALQELRFMSRLLREAVRRGHLRANPIERIGLKKDKPAEKPEMTDEEIKLIREALKSRPEWMQVSFEIALHQGCRLRETSVPFSAIDLEGRTIRFSAKRGVVFTTRLHKDLVPLLAKLKAGGRKTTCDLPKLASKDWHFFFKEIGLPHLCFHCTRVTVITRMARAGVPISQAMAYVGHANQTIHRIYQRLKPADVALAEAAIQVG